MANVITGSVWRLDTAGVVTIGFVSPQTLRWVGGTTAGHRVILKNAAGIIVWEGIASGTNYESESRITKVWVGLTIDTLDSGIVYLEHT